MLEFFNSDFKKLLKKRDVHLLSAHNETKASVVERFNRTLKEQMWTYLTAQNTLKYLDVLPDMVTASNNAHHQSVGRSLSSVNATSELEVRQCL